MADLHQKSFFTPREQLVFFAYLVVTLLLVFFHEPWEDELQAWCIARELSVPEIFYQMRFEGHFALWYLLLKPFAWLGVSVTALNLTSWILCVLAAAAFLTCRRFGLILKILILCSCPLIYWFPVVSRNYALIPPVLCLIAGLYPRRFKHPFAYALALLLLVHTHAYMEGLAGILGVVFVWDLLRHNARRSFRLSLRTAGVSVLLAAGVSAAFFQVFPAFGASSFAPSEFGAVFRNLDSLAGKLGSFLLVMPSEYVFASPSSMPVSAVVSVIFWTLTAWAVIALFRTRGRAGWFFLAGLLWQLLFALLIYPMRMHRVYLPLLMLIFCFALPVRRRRPPRRNRNARRTGMIPLLLLTVMTLPAMFYFTLNDITRPFSSQMALSYYIRTSLPQNAKIVVFPPTLITGTFGAFLPDREFYSCADDRPFRLFRKCGTMPPKLDNDLLERLTGPDRSEIYLLIQTGAFLAYGHRDLQMEYDFPSFTMKTLYGSPERTFFSAGEDYLLFKVTRKTP